MLNASNLNPSKQPSREDAAKLREILRREITSHPPALGVAGLSGAGKSTSLNGMFRTDLPTSATAACTKEFVDTNVDLQLCSGQAAGEAVRLRVVDAPGLGEDLRRDPDYLQMYKEQLPRVDAVLYVVAARNRALAADQRVLADLAEFTPKMVFGLSQCELIEPLDWNTRINAPSEAQAVHLKEIVADRAERLTASVGRPVTLLPYSAATGWGLQKLFAALIDAVPRERCWMLDGLKAFSFEDFIPEAARAALAAATD